MQNRFVKIGKHLYNVDSIDQIYLSEYELTLIIVFKSTVKIKLQGLDVKKTYKAILSKINVVLKK